MAELKFITVFDLETINGEGRGLTTSYWTPGDAVRCSGGWVVVTHVVLNSGLREVAAIQTGKTQRRVNKLN